jgi:hypothetical protein
LLITPHQFSLSRAPALQQQYVPAYSIQPIVTSVFSLSVSISISDITISEFLVWTMNLRKQIGLQLKIHYIIIKTTRHTNSNFDAILGWFQWWAALSLPLDHATSVLSLSSTSALVAVCTSLQYPAYSHVSLLSPSQHHHFRLNHFIIHFMDNEFEKTNWITTENTIHNN